MPKEKIINQKSWVNQFFKLDEYGTNVKTEIIAGITTFVASVYILAVVPGMLSDAGMPHISALAAVIISTALSTILMGLYANFPVVVAPGLGLSAFFAYTICGSMGLNWQTALGAVFISGIVFIILTVTKVRQLIIDSVPECLKISIGVGIGLFIAFIGFKNAGVIVADPSNFVGLGDLTSPGVALFFIGLILTSLFFAKEIKGGLLIGILLTTIIGMFMGITKIPTGLGDLFSIVPPIPEDTFGKLNIREAFEYGIFAVIFTITIVDLFDNIGTLIGVSRKAKLIGEDGKIKNLDKALICDSVATTVGSILGTSTVTTYIESATGVSEGGRTGLTAVTTGVLYLITLFFAPLFLLIPTQATAPVLVIVGILMLSDVKMINFSDFTEALPSFLTILLMPLTFSIAQGIAFGFISYAVIKLFTGKWKEVHPVMYALAICFVVHFLV